MNNDEQQEKKSHKIRFDRKKLVRIVVPIVVIIVLLVVASLLIPAPRSNDPDQGGDSWWSKSLLGNSISKSANSVGSWWDGLWSGNARASLLESIANTTKLEQMKFSVEDSGAGTSLQLDGEYRKGQGLSASSKSAFSFQGVSVEKKSLWAVDSSGKKVYANFGSFNVKPSNSDPATNTPEMLKKMEILTKGNSDRTGGKWLELDKKAVAQWHAYGFQPCGLQFIVEMYQSPDQLQTLAQQFSDSHAFNIKSARESSTTDIYTITANSSQYENLEAVYKKSDVYKSLLRCDSDEYTTSAQSIKDLLDGVTIEIRVDAQNKLISSILIKGKNAQRTDITFTSADNINISVPKNAEKYKTPGVEEMPSNEYMQKYSPYLQKNMEHLKDNVQHQFPVIRGNG